MSTSPDLGFPFIAQQQVEPEVTHNESLIVLTALCKGVVNSAVDTPPGSPTDGDAYIVGSTPTGVWTGKANLIAIAYNGSWYFIPGFNDAGTQIAIGARHEGITIYCQTTNALKLWTGSAWTTKYLTVVAAQQAAIADATGGSTVDTEARAALNDLLAKCRTLGLIAP